MIEAARALAASLAEAGLAVSAMGRVGPYNREVRPLAPEYALPDFGREDALVLLVGNGGELLEALRAAGAKDASLTQAEHPIDLYARETVTRLVAAHLGGAEYEVRFTFDPPPETFAAVRLARLLGLAVTGPTQLSIHPTRGPWLALRAAVVVNAEGPEASPAVEVCAGCEARPCVPAMDAALEAIGGLSRLGRETLCEHADRFIAARQACPEGRGARYPEALLRYHYTLDRALLFGEA